MYRFSGRTKIDRRLLGKGEQIFTMILFVWKNRGLWEYMQYIVENFEQ